MVERRNLTNAPVLSTGTNAILSDPARTGFLIQNVGTNPLFLGFGTLPVNATTYHVILKGGTALSDGSGGTFSMMCGSCYTGTVFATGTGALYTVFAY